MKGWLGDLTYFVAVLKFSLAAKVVLTAFTNHFVICCVLNDWAKVEGQCYAESKVPPNGPALCRGESPTHPPTRLSRSIQDDQSCLTNLIQCALTIPTDSTLSTRLTRQNLTDPTQRDQTYAAYPTKPCRLEPTDSTRSTRPAQLTWQNGLV